MTTLEIVRLDSPLASKQAKTSINTNLPSPSAVSTCSSTSNNKISPVPVSPLSNKIIIKTNNNNSTNSNNNTNRLSLSPTTSLGSKQNQNTKSTTLTSRQSYSSPNSNANGNHVNGNLNKYYDYDDDEDLVHEIPISIVKSPSYTQQLQQSPPLGAVLLSIETVSPHKQKQIEQSLLLSSPKHRAGNKDEEKELESKEFIPLNHSPLSSSSSVIMATTTSTSSSKLNQINNNNNNNNHKNTNDSLNTSDDIDYAATTNNNSQSNLSYSDIQQKTNTLRFNKYGFVQPEQHANNSTGSLNRDSSSLNVIANANGSSPNGKLTNENKSMSSLPSTAAIHKNTTASNNNNSSSNSDLNSNNNNNNRNNITNLKDYLQNTDVEQFAEPLPIEVIRTRETKWIEMLRNFDEWMEKRFKKIKSRCRKGIPQSMRSRAWLHLTGAFLLKKQKPNYYAECLANRNNVDVNRYIEDIKKDLHRQFPSHEIFMKKEGRQMLFNVLKAYAVHNKEVGYCQAQGPIAALLLMHMPEEDSFWMLIRISDVYLKEYFKPGLEKVQIDGQALYILFKKENPAAYKLMKTQSIDPILYMTEWFMCIFARTLPWCTVLRVWDMFFCEGVKVLYRVGIFLMKSAFDNKQKFQRCQQQGMYETLSMLKNLPLEALGEERLVKESSLIRISEEELKKAFEKSAKEFQKQTNEINSKRKQIKNSNSKTK